jgi:hypothetical protein
MSTAYKCDGCAGGPQGELADRLGLSGGEVRHCYGTADTPGTRGLIGSGNYCPCECRSWPHQPSDLWNVAAKANPDDAEARRDAYRALMIEHGHLIDVAPQPEDG